MSITTWFHRITATAISVAALATPTYFISIAALTDVERIVAEGKVPLQHFSTQLAPPTVSVGKLHGSLEIRNVTEGQEPRFESTAYRVDGTGNTPMVTAEPDGTVTIAEDCRNAPTSLCASKTVVWLPVGVPLKLRDVGGRISVVGEFGDVTVDRAFGGLTIDSKTSRSIVARETYGSVSIIAGESFASIETQGNWGETSISIPKSIQAVNLDVPRESRDVTYNINVNHSSVAPQRVAAKLQTGTLNIRHR